MGRLYFANILATVSRAGGALNRGKINKKLWGLHSGMI